MVTQAAKNGKFTNKNYGDYIYIYVYIYSIYIYRYKKCVIETYPSIGKK